MQNHLHPSPVSDAKRFVILSTLNAIVNGSGGGGENTQIQPAPVAPPAAHQAKNQPGAQA